MTHQRSATRTLASLTLASCALAVAALWPSPSSLNAQAGVPPATAPPQSGQAFSISPPLIELQADPGEAVTTKIKFTNVSNSELLVKTQFNDFGAKNETGEPNIIFDDVNNTSYSLRSWITAPAPFIIASGETKTVDFPINVPANSEPGGHYAVIRFTGTSPELQESGVALTASIGSLVLMRVSGDIRESVKVEDFYAATPQFAKSSFFEYAPVNFVERLRNDGNVHLKPTGTIEVFNTFGAKVHSERVNGDVEDEASPPRSVLPESIRRFEQSMAGQWMFGRYEAKLNLEYGQADDRKQLAASTSFWVIPYKLILLVLAVLVGLFFLLRFLIGRYNERVIRNARRK